MTAPGAVITDLLLMIFLNHIGVQDSLLIHRELHNETAFSKGNYTNTLVKQ